MYDEIGCCLTCEEGYEGCLCFECKCRKCEEYDPEGKYCRLAITWKMYQERAEIEKIRGINTYKRFIPCTATFSNGKIIRKVNYNTVSDIPTQIIYHPKRGYPYTYRTLLLKTIRKSKKKFEDLK